MDNGTGQVSLLGATWPIKVTCEFIIRQEVLQLTGDGEYSLRASAAAIGLCWRHPTIPLKARYARGGFKATVYGGDVYNELAGVHKLSAQQILEAGLTCILALADSIPSQEAIDQRADFSTPSQPVESSGDGSASEVGAS
jgi:hypothetical protein